MLTESTHNGRIYNLHGEPITQLQLADYLNETFGTDLKYREMSVRNVARNESQKLASDTCFPVRSLGPISRPRAQH